MFCASEFAKVFAPHEFQLCGCFILTLRLLLLGNFLCIAQCDITLPRVVPGADRRDLFQPTSMLTFQHDDNSGDVGSEYSYSF